MIFSIVILAVSLSLDALGVGVAYGFQKIRIPLSSKLIICFFSIVYSGFAVIIGKSFSTILAPGVSKLIGIAILIAVGFWIILQALFKKTYSSVSVEESVIREKTLFKVAIKSLGITIQVMKNPTDGDLDRSGIIDTSESLLLGLALSMDAIGVGIGSALAGFHSMLIPLAVGLCQLGFIYIGTFVGKKVSSFCNIDRKLIAVLPGFLLIILALVRI